MSSDSPYSDLDRPPLREPALNKAVIRPGGLWRRIEVVRETGSTNADVADAARAQGLEPKVDLKPRERVRRTDKPRLPDGPRRVRTAANTSPPGRSSAATAGAGWTRKWTTNNGNGPGRNTSRVRAARRGSWKLLLCDA